MDAKGIYLEDIVLNYVFRNVTPPSLNANLSVGLFTTEVGEDGSGTEVSGGGYARATVERNTTNFAAPSQVAGAAVTSNQVEVTFPAPTGNWGTVTHAAIFSGSNLLYKGALPNPRSINNGDPAPKFDVGNLITRER